jgi:hypothetical protein
MEIRNDAQQTYPKYGVYFQWIEDVVDGWKHRPKIKKRRLQKLILSQRNFTVINEPSLFFTLQVHKLALSPKFHSYCKAQQPQRGIVLASRWRYILHWSNRLNNNFQCFVRNIPIEALFSYGRIAAGFQNS